MHPFCLSDYRHERISCFLIITEELSGLVFTELCFSSPLLQEVDSWEIIEGLKIGQSNVQRPDKHEGFMLKKRKWPLKGWHKVRSTGIPRHKKLLQLKKKHTAAPRMLNSLLSSKVLFFLKEVLLFRALCFTLSEPLPQA